MDFFFLTFEHTFLGLFLYDLGAMATLTYLVGGPMSTGCMVPCACAMLVEYCGLGCIR